jgi:ribonuclease HI
MHGVDSSYLLVDLYGIQNYFSCQLESICTNNGAEYKALIQGLGKEIDLNVKCIQVFGDSYVVIIGDKFHVLYLLSPHKLLARGMEFDK